MWEISEENHKTRKSKKSSKSYRIFLDFQTPRSWVLKYFAENIWIIGSPNEVSEKIFDLYENVDGFGTIVALGHEWVPKEEWVNSHTVLAKEIIHKLP